MTTHGRAGLLALGIALILGAFPAASPILAGHHPWDQGHDPFEGQPPEDPEGPPEPPCDECKCTGCPVFLDGGNLHFPMEDFGFPASGMSVVIVRSYNSRDQRNGPFGKGWTFNYGMQAIKATDGFTETVIVRAPDGQRRRYEKVGGVFVPPTGKFEQLEEIGGDLVLSIGEGYRWRFDTATSRLEAIEHAAGNRVLLAYDPGAGTLQSVTEEASGRQVLFTFGPNGKVASVTDPLGRVFDYTYDAEGRLLDVARPGVGSIKYTYDANGRLTQILDAMDRVLLAATYDGQGRLQTYTEEGVTWSFQYDPANNQVVKSRGTDVHWTFDFNEDGIVWRSTDPEGHVATRDLDENGSIIGTTFGTGDNQAATFDARGNRTSLVLDDDETWSFEYDPVTNRLVRVVDPDGIAQRYEYDAFGNRTKFVEDDGGALERETTFTYTPDGELASFTTPSGATRSYVYDTRGNRVQTVDPLGNVTTQTFDDLGRLLTLTDPLGGTVSFEYDAAGRRTAVTNPMSGRTEFTWDGAGNILSATSAAGNTTSYTYDSDNQLSSVTDPLGGVTTFSYYPESKLRHRVTDEEGDVIEYAYDKRDFLTTSTDPLGGVTTYGRDALGRIVSVTDPAGSEYQITYDDRDSPLTVRDPLGNVTSYSYDAAGRRTSTTDANGNVTTFAYDRLGRLATITDPLNRSWTYARDPGDRLVSRTDPEGDTIGYTYDALDRLTGESLPGGAAVTRQYDAVGNLTRVTGPDTDLQVVYDLGRRPTQLSDLLLGKSITFQYDARGKRTGMVTPEAAPTSYAYDQLGRLTAVARGSLSVAYAYNADSTLATLTRGNGTVTEYGYDAANRLTQVAHRKSDTALLQSEDYQYDPVANLLQVQYGDGGLLQYTYDAAHRLLTEESTGAVAYSNSYSYDPVGNRLTHGRGCVGATCGENWSYVYDAADQLTSESGPSGITDYSFDLAGNLVQENGPQGLNQYTYDGVDRLIRYVSSSGADVHFAYDADGKRVSSTSAGVTTRYLYEPIPGRGGYGTVQRPLDMLGKWRLGDNVLGEYDAAGTLAVGYLNAPGLDEVVGSQDPSGVSYPLVDRLSSVTGLTDGAEALTDSYRYSAYGVLEDPAGPLPSIGYTGARADESTGLVYLRMRYYRPEIGRFQRRDPFLEASALAPLAGYGMGGPVGDWPDPLDAFGGSPQLHPYAYAAGAPTSFVDPEGLQECFLGAPSPDGPPEEWKVREHVEWRLVAKWPWTLGGKGPGGASRGMGTPRGGGRSRGGRGGGGWIQRARPPKHPNYVEPPDTPDLQFCFCFYKPFGYEEWNRRQWYAATLYCECTENSAPPLVRVRVGFKDSTFFKPLDKVPTKFPIKVSAAGGLPCSWCRDPY